MSDERLSPERAVRLLRAKGSELERYVLSASSSGRGDTTVALAGDLALIAQLLADHIEHMEYLVAHPPRRLTVGEAQALEERDG